MPVTHSQESCTNNLYKKLGCVSCTHAFLHQTEQSSIKLADT